LTIYPVLRATGVLHTGDCELDLLKGQMRGFQIGQMSLENIPVVQRNKQKDFGVSDFSDKSRRPSLKG
jgi:hypothetical protein